MGGEPREASDRPAAACYAAHSALYFRPDGLVHACCVTGFAVGSVIGRERQSLREIWNGAALRAQRAALEAHSYEFGCQECEVAQGSGGRQASLAYHFDRFASDTAHEFPKLLDLALSSRCNLMCVMCNGSLSSAIRTRREGLPPLPDVYDDRFFEELDEFLPHVERLQFKGGEPFLAPENRRIWDRLIDIGHVPEVSVTTNGTLFNDHVERYVRELRVHPNISVDGMRADTLESIRVGVDAERLWRHIDRFQELAEVAGNGMTLSYCLMGANWREVLPFLLEADRRAVNCNVIFVNQPPEYDLLRTPVHELAEIYRELSSNRPQFRTSEPERVWHELLDRIRSQIEHPVEIVVHAAELTPPPIGQEEQALLRVEIEREHGLAPLVLEAEDGIVCALDLPDWAGWLQPSGWVGQRMDGLAGTISEEVGALTSSVLTSDRPGVELISLEIDTVEGSRLLRLHLFVDEATGRRRGFLVERQEDLDPASADPPV